MTTTTQECHVLILDDVLHTRASFVLPVPPDEALKTCLDLARAVDFARWYGEILQGEETALGVSVRKGSGQVCVRWHPIGDPDEAARELRSIHAGTWRPEL